MNKNLLKLPLLSALLTLAILAPVTTYGQKPDWKDSGKQHKVKDHFNKGDRRSYDQRRVVDDTKRQSGVDHHKNGPSHQGRSAGLIEGPYFRDHHRIVIRNYHADQFRSGHCPPGLAKKNNGCLPPGQAKKWQIGRPLPRNVVIHDLPPAVVLELGPVPAGHRFVRVASDILLIAIGTGMVIDAIQDLGEL